MVAPVNYYPSIGVDFVHCSNEVSLLSVPALQIQKTSIFSESDSTRTILRRLTMSRSAKPNLAHDKTGEREANGIHDAAVEHYEAVIIGAGFGGLRVLWELRSLGVSARIIERGSDVGGTWYW